jgi:hypothetical protein
MQMHVMAQTVLQTAPVGIVPSGYQWVLTSDVGGMVDTQNTVDPSVTFPVVQPERGYTVQCNAIDTLGSVLASLSENVTTPAIPVGPTYDAPVAFAVTYTY